MVALHLLRRQCLVFIICDNSRVPFGETIERLQFGSRTAILFLFTRVLLNSFTEHAFTGLVGQFSSFSYLGLGIITLL
jgi:hypothetical protein